MNFRSPPEYDRNRSVRSLSATHASPGFGSLQRLQNRGATYPGLTSPGYAAPSGFRTLLTPCSPRNLSALFQTVTLLGFHPSKVSPFASWVRSLDQPCPHGVGSNGRVCTLADTASLASRAIHSAKVRGLLRCKQRVWLDPPLSFLPLQGCFSLSDGLARRELLLPWTLIRPAANRRPSPVLRSVDRREPRSSPKRSPPLLGSFHLVSANRVSVAEQVSNDPRNPG